MKQTVLNMIILLLLSPFPAVAETAEEKGLSTAREAEMRDSGFKDFTADLLMILKNRHGKESIRKIRSRSLEVEGDGDKTLSIFDTPRDVKGTAFLTFSHKKGDDDQWLYLPALKRVKRISSRNKSGSFMGSEFAYEDLSSQEVEKYTYKWIKNERYNGLDCFVVERYPVDRKHSGYTRQINWIDTKEYRLFKSDYYDRKDALLKTLILKDYHRYLEKFWRPDEMIMINHQNGKSTRLIWSNHRFRVGLKERDFNKNSLKRLK